MKLCKSKSRKNNISQKKISLVLIITILFTFFNFKINNVKADTVKEIRILEIQPDANYFFTSRDNVNGYKVTVDQIGMPEFIGRVDQLNGKYDVIVIGNKGNSYTNPLSSKPSKIYHNGSAVTNGDPKWWWEKGSGDHIEYYSENDITNKRAEEIKEMINSGQLVYMESSILSKSTLNKTKLYSNFKDINKNNFKKTSIDKLSLETIVNDYKNIDYSVKRPVFDITKSPEGDSEDNISLENRNMIFKGKVTPSSSDEKLVVNLYIDINGDSLFRESDKELVSSKEINISDSSEVEFQLDYTMPIDFVGQLDWKIELERITQNESNVKNYKTGQVKYKSINGEKPKINVLQVYLDESSKLDTNNKFNELIKQIDYEINLNYRKLSDFNKEIESGKLTLDSFDMIIIGFGDFFYSNTSTLNDKAAEKLKEFIKTGQSVMFTHDNISLLYHNHLNTQEFRDILGQSRFTDEQYNPDGKDLFGNLINHDTEVENQLGDKWSMGYTKGHLYRYDGGGLKYSENVSEINSGLISQYPFDLSSSSIGMSVQKTHGQYYQLNLEHPDLVTWYVLDDTYSNKNNYYYNNDARNNYYTYSIGNLTYSGTGHSNNLSSYGEDEIKLFINTIVKAARGANSAPIIDALSDEVTEISDSNEFIFNAIIKDFNGDKVRITEVIVGGLLDSSTGAVQNGTGENIWESDSEEYYDSGASFDITIPKNIIEKNSGNETNVTIKAIDDRGASSEKTYKIKPVSDPVLKVYDYSFVGMAGEESTIYMTMEKQNNDNSFKNIYDIKAQIEKNNFIDVSEITVEENSNKIKVTFKTKGIIDGQAVDVKVNYKVGNDSKITTAKIILYTNNLDEIPSISAKLLSDDRIEVKGNEDITIKYEITPEDFIYNNVSNNGEKDVLFLIDTSKDSENVSKSALEASFGKILNSMDSSTKYAAITFNDNANILFDFNYSGDKDSGGYANSINQRKFKQIQYEGNSRSIGKALELVEEVFKTARSTSNKNIVILTKEDVIYIEDNYKNIRDKGYNIITLSYDLNNSNSSLYELHNQLNGKNNNILFVNNDQNAINNSLMTDIKNRIESFSAVKPYEFNPVIKLGLGNNFEPVSGIIKTTENNKGNIGVAKISTITYNLTQNNNYHAESKIIEIKIKANDLSPGIYTLGNVTDNIMTYKNLSNNDVSIRIKTPIIIVKEEVKNITHGLYNGINNGQISIQENNDGNPFEIAQGSTVTFGAKFTFSGNSTEFNLNVDNKFSSLNTSDIKIYKVSKDSSGNSTLEELKDTNKSIVVSGDNKFKISINNITDSSSEILVVYQGKIKDDTESGKELTNDIIFSSTSKKATIVTQKKLDNSPILPDLF